VAVVVDGPKENGFVAGADVAGAVVVVAPVVAAGAVVAALWLKPPKSGFDAGAELVCACVSGADVWVEGGPKEKVGLGAAAVSDAAGFENRMDPVFSCGEAAPNNDDMAPDDVCCDVADVDVVGAAVVVVGGPKEKADFGASVAAGAAGVDAEVDSAGFGAPKLNPPVAGLDPNSPPDGADDPVAGASGFGKPNVGFD
jgi:hypothetical protein